MKQADIVVVGAGLGGMAAAARLARMGHRVEIWEKNEIAGGKLRELRLGDYTWDTGPSLVTMPHVLRELFSFCGVELTERLDLIRLPSACRYFWDYSQNRSGGGMVYHVDEDEAFWKRPDVAAFLRYAEGIYELSGEAYLNHPPEEFWRAFTLQNLPKLRHLPKVATFQNMAQVVRRFFRQSPWNREHPSDDAFLQQLFNRFATYNGSSPYQTPATFNIIPYVEAEFGAWYPRGGLVSIAREIEKLAREMGVVFRFGETAADFAPSHRPSSVSGLFGAVAEPSGGTITSTSGRWAEVDALICNADVLTARGTFLRSLTSPEELNSIRSKPLSCSGFILYLGVRHRYPQLRHHNIFFSDDYPREFADIFDRKQLPSQPTIYISISARTDPARISSAPGPLPSSERDNYFVLINAPAWPDEKPLDEAEKQRYRNVILDRLEHMGLTGLRGHIEEEQIFTPKDFAERDLTWQGSLYGWASHSIGTALFRPPMRMRSDARVWCCGGTTHPGGGIPLVLLSGKMAAEAVARELHPSHTE
ncbi:MAG: phytoene desaturase family protein [Candidatus Methylacidiphilales bacterium]|nr:phytoene desaturase family protein [Candidatus Methylacidiphilales bacterium]